MWFAIVFIVSLFLASSVLPKSNAEDARVEGLGENAFPTSAYGSSVPIVFGTCEQKSPIVTWFGHYSPQAEYQDVSTGFFSTDRVISQWRYLLGFDLAICLGPNIVLRQIKGEGGKILWGGGVAEAGRGMLWENISIQNDAEVSGGVEFHTGDFNAVRSPYMISGPGGGPHWTQGAGVVDLPNYAGICHAVFVQFFIGNRPNPPRFSFVVENLTNNLSATHSIMDEDLNPMEIAYTTLTGQWGYLGVDPLEVDKPNFEAAAAVLFAEGIKMSMVVDGEKTGKQIIDECMRVADGVMYYEPTTGKMMVKLVRDDYTVGSLPILDESNIIGPLKNFGKTTWEDTVNQVRVEYQSREMGYQNQIAIAQDFAAINENGGKIKSVTITMPGVKASSVAAILAKRELSMLSVPLFKCELTCNRIAKDWRPGGLFVLNWPTYNVTNAVMRIVKIDLGDLYNNEITITCVQDKFARDLITFSPPGSSSHVPIDVSAAHIGSDRLVWYAPLFLASKKEYVDDAELRMFETQDRPVVLAKHPSSSSTAFDSFISRSSGGPYASYTTDSIFQGYGKLEAAYNDDTAVQYDGIHTGANVVVYGVDQRAIDSLVNHSTLDEARGGDSLVLIGQEIMMFVGFTDLGSGRVRLNNLYRWILNTRKASGNIPVNTDVWFLRKSLNVGNFGITFRFGESAYYKFVNKTPLGSADPTTAPVTSVSFLDIRQDNPLPPTNVRINGAVPKLYSPYDSTSTNTFTVTWNKRSRKDPVLYTYTETYDSDFEENYGVNGLRYSFRWRVAGGAWTTISAITGTTSGSFTTTTNGLLECEVTSYYRSSYGTDIYSDAAIIRLTLT